MALGTQNFTPAPIFKVRLFLLKLKSTIILALFKTAWHFQKTFHDVGVFALPKLDISQSYPLQYATFLISGPVPCAHLVQ